MAYKWHKYFLKQVYVKHIVLFTKYTLNVCMLCSASVSISRYAADPAWDFCRVKSISASLTIWVMLEKWKYSDQMEFQFDDISYIYLVCRWNARDEKAISLHELVERMANRISGSANPDSFHHAGVSQLSTAETPVEHLRSDFGICKIVIMRLIREQEYFSKHYHRFLVFVRFDTSYEERLATT